MASDRLEGWKAIADYLKKTERTVQRWEKSRGLPVRRFESEIAEEQPRVFAYRAEIDSWWESHSKLKDAAEEDDSAAPAEQADPSDASAAPLAAPARSNPWSRTGVWVAIAVLATSGLIASIFWPRLREMAAPRGQKVILAIVPFKNLSGDAGPQEISEALTEEMISGLGRIHPERLGVIGLSRPATGSNIEQLGRAAHADYLLEGTVRRSGNRLAITAQLILVKDQTRVWGDSYERDLVDPQDVIPIEIETATAIRNEVLNQFAFPERPAHAVNRETYQAYLTGRYFWNKRTTASLQKAVTYFKTAIASDPRYAPAYAGLADCYFLLGSVPYTAMPPKDAMPLAEAAALKALELDSSLAEAHVSLGYTALVYRRDYPKAEQEFRRAIELRPAYATAHEFYGYYLLAMGRIDEAIAERRTARDLDPLSPLFNTALAEMYYHARQFDRSIAENQKALELDPAYPTALMNLAVTYEQQRKFADADRVFEAIRKAAPDEPAVIAFSVQEYAASGRRAQALALLHDLQQLATHRYVAPLWFALAYAGLNDMDQAFSWIDRAYDENCEYLVYLSTEPLADGMRRDPRFAVLLKRLGVPAHATVASVRPDN